jgi:hypothetical protein
VRLLLAARRFASDNPPLVMKQKKQPRLING